MTKLPNLWSRAVRWGAGAVGVSCLLITTAAGAQCVPSWVTALGGGMNNVVTAFTTFDDGSGGGPKLYAGGQFTTAGGVPANRIGSWDGTTWSALGSGISGAAFTQVTALIAFDDGLGGGPALYAAGAFTTAGGTPANSIARWDGTAWSALGSGVNGDVWDMAVFDDGLGGGSKLYACGLFTMAGGHPANHIACWSGTSWSALGTGTNNSTFALSTFDDGSGTKLYVGGQFTGAGGLPGSHGIARWNGTTWSALGSIDAGAIYAFTTFDDGSGGGPALYAAGGPFTMVGGIPAKNIARWNGTTWSALGSGINNFVNSLTTFDDGSGGGTALYAGGLFTTAGGVAANRIARWSGTSWSALGSGLNNTVAALASFDDGSGGGPSLYAGGYFTTAGGISAKYISKWQGCTPDVPGDLNGDGAVNARDLGILLGGWGLPGISDINGDGTTDASDLAVLLGAWTG